MGSELFYSVIIVISLGIFFYFGNFRASNKQTNRPDRINWGKSIFKKLKKFGDKGGRF